MPWTLHTKKATDQCTERKQHTHTAHCGVNSVPISGKQSTDLIVIQVNPSLILIQRFRGPQQQHQQHQGRVILQHKPTHALFSFGNRTQTPTVLVLQHKPTHALFSFGNSTPNTHSSCTATQITIYSVLVDRAFHPKQKVCS